MSEHKNCKSGDVMRYKPGCTTDAKWMAEFAKSVRRWFATEQQPCCEKKCKFCGGCKVHSFYCGQC